MYVSTCACPSGALALFPLHRSVPSKVHVRVLGARVFAGRFEPPSNRFHPPCFLSSPFYYTRGLIKKSKRGVKSAGTRDWGLGGGGTGGRQRHAVEVRITGGEPGTNRCITRNSRSVVDWEWRKKDRTEEGQRERERESTPRIDTWTKTDAESQIGETPGGAGWSIKGSGEKRSERNECLCTTYAGGCLHVYGPAFKRVREHGRNVKKERLEVRRCTGEGRRKMAG